MDELDELYRSRFDVFTRVAASVMGDSERARDAVQEAFATAVRKRRSFRGDGPLEAWVWRIVLNAAHSDVRRAVPAVDDDEPVASNGHTEDDPELRVALARLPEQQRTAVFLRYYADLDYVARVDVGNGDSIVLRDLEGRARDRPVRRDRREGAQWPCRAR